MFYKVLFYQHGQMPVYGGGTFLGLHNDVFPLDAGGLFDDIVCGKDGDAAAPSFHQTALEEDIGNDFVDGFRMGTLAKVISRSSVREVARVHELNAVVKDCDAGRTAMATFL